jgi:hypothetical protein
MSIDQLTHLGSGHAANNFREQDKSYGKTQFNVPAVVKLLTHDDTTNHSHPIFGVLIVSLDIIRRIW